MKILATRIRRVMHNQYDSSPTAKLISLPTFNAVYIERLQNNESMDWLDYKLMWDDNHAINKRIK